MRSTSETRFEQVHQPRAAEPRRRYSGGTVTAVTCPCQLSRWLAKLSALPRVYPIDRQRGLSRLKQHLRPLCSTAGRTTCCTSL